MFVLWCEYRDDGGAKRVAAEIGRSPKTVLRWAKKLHFEKRYQREVSAPATDKANKQARKRAIDKLKITETMLGAAIDTIFPKDEDGNRRLKANVQIRDIERLIRLHEDLTGGATGPEEGTGLPPELVAAAIQIGKRFDDETVKRIGDLIATGDQDFTIQVKTDGIEGEDIAANIQP